MSDPTLPLLLLILGGLGAVAVASALVPAWVRPALGFIAVGLGGLGCLLALLALVVTATPTTLTLPIGPPGLALHLLIDPLSAWFLLLVFIAGTGVLAFNAGTGALGFNAGTGALGFNTGTGALGFNSGTGALGFNAGTGVPAFVQEASAVGAPASETPASETPASGMQASGMQASGRPPLFEQMAPYAITSDAPADVALLSSAPDRGPFPTHRPTTGPSVGGQDGLSGAVVTLAALGLVVLAADAVTRSLGIIVVGAAVWSSGSADRSGVPPFAYALLAAFLLALPASWSAGAVGGFAVLLAGAAALGGLVPLQGSASLPSTGGQMSPARLHALVAGCVGPVALFVLARGLVVQGGAAPPFWPGLILLASGLATALRGAWRGVHAAHCDGVASGLAQRQVGLGVLALGLTHIARAADLPEAAALAFAATLLLAAGQAVCVTLLALVASAVHSGAGIRRLDGLGGIIHTMPVTSGAAFAASSGVLVLPCGLGFAAHWLLFHALVEAPLGNGAVLNLVRAGTIAGLALSGAVATAAIVRLLGVVFLGRPRLPRTAAAQEVPKAARPALYGLGAVALVLGLLPGAVPGVLANAAGRWVTGTDMAAKAGLFRLSAAAEPYGYAVIPLVLVFGGFVALARWLPRRAAVVVHDLPVWDDGFAPPPPWLPCGDPLTQIDATGFTPEWYASPMVRSFRDGRPAWYRTAMLTVWPARMASPGSVPVEERVTMRMPESPAAARPGYGAAFVCWAILLVLVAVLVLLLLANAA